MSHKGKRDYKAVFSKLLELITDPTEGYPRVEEIVSDFEAAVWTTLKKLLPNVLVMGCSFHINQAMFKNLKKLGLGPLYQDRKDVRTICRQILSLNLLPHNKIEKRFKDIEEKVAIIKEDKLTDFCSYVRSTWITSAIWPPKQWSMFMQH
jgi:hypothetical protein